MELNNQKEIKYNLEIDKPYLKAYINTIGQKSVNEHNITCRFNGFKFPSLLFKSMDLSCDDVLFICVDHNFNIKEEFKSYNFIFIDHHISERENDKYGSNSKMMVEHYNEIKNSITKYVNSFSNIIILMHNDLDGIASGMIAKAIVNDILYQTNTNKLALTLLEILGCYGDIDSSKNDVVKLLYADSKKSYIMDKKFESIRKTFGDVFKSTRPIHDLLMLVKNRSNMSIIMKRANPTSDFCINKLNVDYDELDDEETKLYYDMIDYIQYIKKFDIDMLDILNIFYNICKDIETCNKIDEKFIIYIINKILSDRCIIKIRESYKKVSGEIIEQYIGNTSYPIKLETTGIFTCNNENEKFSQFKYKLIIIDSWFDIARSIIFQYENHLRQSIKNSLSVKYGYSINEWISAGKDITKLTENIVCYNIALNKLTFTSKNNTSAYDISSELFAGGGHTTSEGALGSCNIKNKNELFDKFKIVDIF